jgi:hypothetical protein
MHAQRHRGWRLVRGAAIATVAAALAAPVGAERPQPDPPIPPETLRPALSEALAPALSETLAPALLLASAETAGPAPADGLAPSPAPIPAAAVGEVREPDCRCGALYVRDLSRRIEGHVERWESLPRAPLPESVPARWSPPLHRVHLTALLVDGVVGFPLHDFRLSD